MTWSLRQMLRHFGTRDFRGSGVAAILTPSPPQTKTLNLLRVAVKAEYNQNRHRLNVLACQPIEL